MNFVMPSPNSVFVFMLVVLFVVNFFIIGSYIAAQNSKEDPNKVTIRVALIIFLWISILSGVVSMGWIDSQPMPRLMIFFASIIIGSLAFSFSKYGRLFATGLPLFVLVSFQGFRLLLEFVLHLWADQGTIPVSMSWSGQNYDFVAGAFAIIAGFLIYKGKMQRPLAWAANIVGIVLLVNVARVAVMSSPLPFAWKVNPPLQLVNHLPYAMIAHVCVAGAIVGHAILTMALVKGQVAKQA